MINKKENWKHFLEESKFILFDKRFNGVSKERFGRIKYFYWQLKSLIYDDVK